MSTAEIDLIKKQIAELEKRITGINIADSPYPLWTDQVDYPAQSASSANGAPAGSAGEAIGAVLGWRFNPRDPRGFANALRRAFTVTEDAGGNTTVTWVPPSYNVQAIEVGVGNITGAQASIRAQARVTVEQVLPLLDQLRPLDEDESDEEDVEALLALIRPELAELVDQLGAEGGPVPQRVDSLFELLLEPDKLPTKFELTDPERVRGQLGLLGRRLGMRGGKVNTVEEEERLTGFRIAVNYVDTLRLSWQAQREFFDRDNEGVFFGTQLVLIIRALSVLAESVQEAYFAMDSVFLRASERQTMRLKTDPPITVAELLSWVEEVASSKGVEIIRKGGKDGVIHAFTPIVEKLYGLVDEAATQSAGVPDNSLPDGFYTKRVQGALKNLRANLYAIRDLVRPIKRTSPKVRDFDPADVALSTLPSVVELTINGEDFDPDALVKLAAQADADKIKAGGFDAAVGIPADPATTVNVSDTQVDADFTFDAAAFGNASALELYVVVGNPDGSYALSANKLRVTRTGYNSQAPTEGADPEVRAINTLAGAQWAEAVTGESYDLAVAGRNFRREVFCDFGRGVRASVEGRRSNADVEEIIVRVSVSSAAGEGPRSLTVVTFDDQRDVKTLVRKDAFVVKKKRGGRSA